MSFLAIALIVFIGAVYAAPLSDEERIIGGSDAPDGQYPHQISLRSASNPRTHSCGGSIISDTWILTAAHCVHGQSASSMLVVVGSNQISSGGTTYKVVQSIPHQQYDPQQLRNDIAVLKIQGRIAFGPKVKAISLASSPPGSGTRLTLSGWGAIAYPQNTSPNNLQHIHLNAVGISECRSAVGNVRPVDDTNVCTFLAHGRGACFGDSGGPLISGNTQVGVVSWGVPCAQGKPDVFASVAAYRNWIRSNSGV